MTRFNRILVFVALLMFSTTAFAMIEAGGGNYRLNVLSGGDGFNANYWEDSNCVQTWHGELVNYMDMLTINIDKGEGVALSKSIEGYGGYHLGLYRGFMDSSNEYNNIVIGYGYELETMNLGFVFNRQTTSMTVGGDGGGDIKETGHGFGIGVDYTLDDETNIDGYFRMAKMSDDNETVDDYEGLDASGMGFGVRAFHALEDGMTVIPVFTYWKMSDYPAKDISETNLALGAALNYEINDGNNLIVGFNWQKNTDKNETGDEAVESTTTTFPGMNIAVEHEFFDWLTVRAGATKNWVKSEDNDENVQMDYPYHFELGAGIALGDWQIDLGLNTDWLYNLGYWVHGNIAEEEPISGIQVKLYF